MGLFFSLSDRDRARTLCDEKYVKEELKNVEQVFIENGKREERYERR